MLIGYARVSTHDQNLERQIDQLQEKGCGKIFMEKITGTTTDRPELEKLLDYIRQGDTVVVTELSRLSRSTKDLFGLLEKLESSGCHLVSLKESWLDTTTPHGRMMFTFVAGISQFERDLISQRTKEGLEAARARGRKGGRPSADKRLIETALKMYESRNHSISEITKVCGVSKGTLYKYIKGNEDSLNKNKPQ